MSLSQSIRHDCEAAPWVVEEVKKLERELAATTRDADEFMRTLSMVRKERDEAREMAKRSAQDIVSLEERLAESKEQARLAWERAAEKDAAYAEAIKSRDDWSRRCFKAHDTCDDAIRSVIAASDKVVKERDQWMRAATTLYRALIVYAPDIEMTNPQSYSNAAREEFLRVRGNQPERTQDHG